MMMGAIHPMCGQIAPELNIDVWFNLKTDKSTPKLNDFINKIIYIYCFQNWCHGCHVYGFPTLKHLITTFADSPNIVFLSVQTVFEGFSENTDCKIFDIIKRYHLVIPIGHDDGKGRGSTLMRDYHTFGTPWHIIIDKSRTIIYCDFHIDSPLAIKLITQALGS